MPMLSQDTSCQTRSVPRLNEPETLVGCYRDRPVQDVPLVGTSLPSESHAEEVALPAIEARDKIAHRVCSGCWTGWWPTAGYNEVRPHSALGNLPPKEYSMRVGLA